VALSAATYVAVLWIVLAALLALAAGKPPLRTSLITAATVWTADLLAALLKLVFQRTRPYEVIPEADPLLRWDLGSSMPSGHAAAGAAGAVILGYLLGGRWAWAVGLLALAVGFARVYIGVHYPSDVLAGAAVGVVVGLAAAALVRRLQPTSAGPQRSAQARPGG
jgi:membrane-associated phospholipid phosphatase